MRNLNNPIKNNSRMLLRKLAEMMKIIIKKEARKEDLRAKGSQNISPKEVKRVSKKAKATKEDDF